MEDRSRAVLPADINDIIEEKVREHKHNINNYGI